MLYAIHQFIKHGNSSESCKDKWGSICARAVRNSLRHRIPEEAEGLEKVPNYKIVDACMPTAYQPRLADTLYCAILARFDLLLALPLEISVAVPIVLFTQNHGEGYIQGNQTVR